MRTDTGKVKEGLKPVPVNDLLRSPWSGSERDQTFLNLGGSKFIKVSALSALNDPRDGRCFAILDFDHDGQADLVTTNLDFPSVRLFLNQINTENPSFLAIQLVGGNQKSEPDADWSNRDAVGARVEVVLDNDARIFRERAAGAGLSSQNSSTLLTPLGPGRAARQVTVNWPSGKTTQITPASPDTLKNIRLKVYENPDQGPDGRGWVASSYEPRGPTKASTSIAAAMPPFASAQPPAQLTLYVATATWCASCKGELPRLAQLRSRFDSTELRMVGVPIDPTDDESKLGKYEKQYQPAYQLLTSRSPEQIDWMTNLATRVLGGEALPFSALCDGEGQVLWIGWGTPTTSVVREKLERPRPDLTVHRKLRLPKEAPVETFVEELETLLESRKELKEL